MKTPSLVVADNQGNILEVETHAAVGRSGRKICPIPENEWIKLPFGSDLFLLPDRIALGMNRKTDVIETVNNYNGKEVFPVAAFIAPAYTLLYNSAYVTKHDSVSLPLYAYGVAGVNDEGFYTSAIRIDSDIRQDPANFNPATIERNAVKLEKLFKRNRLAMHLIENCVRKYGCPAARNFVLNRWEMPLPTSIGCNARCVGCISKQDSSGISPTQERLKFIPSPEEITELVKYHFKSAVSPIASFGQGCEGEPLTNPDLLVRATHHIKITGLKGTLNINTNGYNPTAIRELCIAGMDSFRISLNSVREKYYTDYFRPQNYKFEDVLESMRIIKSKGKFLSINYFVFPGFTDNEEEISALRELLREIPVDLIQWRNLNIDPDWYLNSMKIENIEGIGIINLMNRLKEEFKELRYGYFNPYLK